MRIHFRGLFAPASVAALAAVLIAGCGGGGVGVTSSTQNSTGTVGKTATGSGNGVTATGTLSGSTLSITAHTDRSDIAQVWVNLGTGSNATLTGSGQNWAGSVQVSGDANSIVTADVYALDALGNQWGPAHLQVRLGEFGAQPGVTGVVLSSADSSPVVGATVTIGNQSATTDSSGRFVITGLVAGSTMHGTVVKNGFQDGAFDVTITAETQQIANTLLTPTPDLPPPVPVFP